MSEIKPDLANATLLYAIQERALEISRSIPTHELSIAYNALAFVAAYIAQYLEAQDLGRLLDEERARSAELERMLTVIHTELQRLRDAAKDV